MKRRFIQMKEPPYDLIEVSLDYEPDSPRRDGLLYNDRDYDGLRATDGTDIGSRSKHREYMRRNGLCTIDDFKESNAKAAQQRAAFYEGKSGSGAVTRSHIHQAIEQLQSRRK